MKSSLNKNGESSSVIGTIYSYSTLKSMTKDDLIDLLGIAQHNYECSQNGIYNITKYAKKLDKALDKACELIGELGGCSMYMFDKYISCQESCTNNPKKCWREYLLKGDKE